MYFKYIDTGQSPEDFRANLASLEEAGFKPPPEEEWPPIYAELPYEAQQAIRIYYVLPLKTDGMAGFLGKDINSIKLIFEMYEIEEDLKRFIFELVLFIININLELYHKKQKAAEKTKGANK